MEEEKQELKRQLKEEKEIIVKLENEEKAKSRVLHLVYEKLLGIEGRTGEGSEQSEVMGQIDQVIEQKVDELKLKLAQEQTEHEKAYESLSKAEDHIVLLYADIERLKNEASAKENALKLA